MIDGEDESKGGFVAMVSFAIESYEKDKDGSIAGNKDRWFKQEKGSMTQDERHKMDGWERFLLRNMHGK